MTHAGYALGRNLSLSFSLLHLDKSTAHHCPLSRLVAEIKSQPQTCGSECEACSSEPRTEQVLREQAPLFAKCCWDLVRHLFPGGWERGRGILGRHDSKKGLRLPSETDLDASPGPTTYLGSHFISLGLSFFICQVALTCLPRGSPRAHYLQITRPCPGIVPAQGGSQ